MKTDKEFDFNRMLLVNNKSLKLFVREKGLYKLLIKNKIKILIATILLPLYTLLY